MSSPGDAGRAEATVAAAETHRRAGRLAQARSMFAQAAEAAEAEGDTDSLIGAALGIGGVWVYEERGFVERTALEALWKRAAQQVEPDSLRAARLAVRVAAEAVYEGGPIEAVEQAAGAVDEFGDAAATAEASSLLHHVLLGPAHAHSRLLLAEDIVRTATRAGDGLLSLMGLCWRTVDLYLLGDRRADQSLEELRARPATAGCEAVAFVVDVMSAMRLARSGALSEAETAAAAACDRGCSLGDPDAIAYLWALVGALRWWQGRGSEIIDEVRATASSPKLAINDHVYVAADAALSAALGDFDEAEEALARLNATGLETLRNSSSWLTTQLLAAEAAFVLGDADTASTIRPLVEPYAELPVMPSLAVVCLGSAHRTLGLVAATCGDFDAAVDHLDTALRVDQSLGNRPMGVLTEQTLSQVLRARLGDGDHARAEALASRAVGRAARLGMSLPASPAWITRRSAAHHSGTLGRCPEGWRVEVDGRATLIADRVGIGYLATLLGAPGQDLHVLRILADNGSPPLEQRRPQPVLDSGALGSYRARAQELADRLRSPATDPAQASRLRSELNGIQYELRTATGRDGKPRDFPTDQERARTAVRKALLRATAAIRAAEPGLGYHLQQNVTTGVTCRYEPGGGWLVRIESRARQSLG